MTDPTSQALLEAQGSTHRKFLHATCILWGGGETAGDSEYIIVQISVAGDQRYDESQSVD